MFNSLPLVQAVHVEGVGGVETGHLMPVVICWITSRENYQRRKVPLSPSIKGCLKSLQILWQKLLNTLDLRRRRREICVRLDLEVIVGIPVPVLVSFWRYEGNKIFPEMRAHWAALVARQRQQPAPFTRTVLKLPDPIWSYGFGVLSFFL